MAGSAIVAIVGRPNVGKSALFNRIAGRKISIVDDTVGVTRDRIFSDCEWAGVNFSLVDTGGLEFKAQGVGIDFLSEVRTQVEISVEQADVIVLVVDLRCGVTSLDYEISKMLQKFKKNVVVCVNKCDYVGEIPSEFYDFYGLGFKNIFAVSAIHGYGVGDFLDFVISNFQKKSYINSEENDLKVAIVGRPNVGKSSILNKILGEKRTIVSNLAGTTRDSIDVKINYNGFNFTLIDTAGIIKKSKHIPDVEHYSLIRTYMAIDRADICLVVFDGVCGLLEQDVKIAGYVHNKGKGSLILINKLDLISNREQSVKALNEKLKVSLNFMSYFQHIYISAKTGQRLNKIFELVMHIKSEREKRFSTGVLNNLLSFCVSKFPTPNFRGKRLKIYYVTQVDVNPPTFVFFVNNVDYFHFSYKRYLENQIRLAFGFKGTPIRIVARVRNDK